MLAFAGHGSLLVSSRDWAAGSDRISEEAWPEPAMWFRIGKNSAAERARRRQLGQLADQVARQLARLLDAKGLWPQKPASIASRLRRGCSRRGGAAAEAVLDSWSDLCWQQALASGWPEPPSGVQLLAIILEHLAVRAGAPADCPAAWPVLLAESGQIGWLRPESRDRLRARLAQQGLLLAG